MNIRPAVTADLPDLILMFVELLDYLKGINPSLSYATNRDQLIGGCLETLRAKMTTLGHAVFVAEIDGQVKGFVAGCLMRLPGFHEPAIVGSCEWLYPLDIPVMRPLMERFEEWAKGNGAEGLHGYTPEGSKSERVMRRHKMKPQYTTFFKKFEV